MTDEVDSFAATSTATASRDPPPPTDDVDLSELLSTCIDACRRGCEVIRNVRHRSLLRSDDDDAHDAVTYKIADDPRSALTEADGASQKVIIECLASCWSEEIESGKIKIVGEEEDDHSTDLEGDKSFDTVYSDDMMSHFDNYNCPRTDREPIIRDMFRHLLPSPPAAALDVPSTTRSRPRREERGGGDDMSSSGGIIDEIIIFIDPMDGTREFVEGRIHNVQCLIGITLNGRPVAGAMGMPMVHDAKIEVAYGLITLEGGGMRGGDEDDGGSSESSVIPIPVLSGIKFFDALNPLVRDVPPNVGVTGKNDESGDDRDYDDDHDGEDDNEDKRKVTTSRCAREAQ
jgi:3'-phosphoadenosine 5'-phosphosulfate (PAPS) 3'-phosphatase